jgi:FkbM family methyltransferase
MKATLRNLILSSHLDWALGFLLRVGALPRLLEPLAPLPAQYPKSSLRKLQRDGLSLDVDLSDLPDWKAYFRRRDRKRSWIYQFVRPGMKVWEVGCHKGWVALHLAQATGPSGRVIAIDGNPEHVRIGNARFRENGFRWAEAKCALLSSTRGEASLDQWSEGNSASFTIAPGKGGIALDTLDHWQKENNEADPDLIKVTINGWELHALLGAEEIIRRRKPALVIEVGDGNLRSAGHSAGELVAFLRRHQYQIAVREKNTGRTLIEPPNFPVNDCLEDVYATPLA